jgi:hypothetical protein
MRLATPTRIPCYGAAQVGPHRFYELNVRKDCEPVGVVKFIRLWHAKTTCGKSRE